MKWKWVVSFFLCLFLICMAYCLEYQKTMYEIEKKQIEILSGENLQEKRQKILTEKKRLDVYTKVV
ncbi:MAG: hypothetical protein Q4B90_00285 [Eubacteriales bacterium]|nr:hypothetical protein [Eubacteriales bacterium]